MSALRDIVNKYSNSGLESDSCKSDSCKSDSYQNYHSNYSPIPGYKYDNLCTSDSYTKYNSQYSYDNYYRNRNIIKMYDWIMHIDHNSMEYVSGYCSLTSDSSHIWDTSYIKDKIPLSDTLLIITENESIYELPYKECNTV